MADEHQLDDWTELAGPCPIDKLDVTGLLARADEPSEDWGIYLDIVQELRLRKSPEADRLLLALLADVDQDAELRVRLLDMALAGESSLSYSAWWLMTYDNYGHFEYQEHQCRVSQLMSSVDSDTGGAGRALTEILANERLAASLRALAGVDLIDLLGSSAFPLLNAHLDDLTEALASAAKEHERARTFLWGLAHSSETELRMRIEATEAYQRLDDDRGVEVLLAGLATAEGLPLGERLDLIERAVNFSDNASAEACLAMLHAIVEGVDVRIIEKALECHLRSFC